jgi:hypothetical protein
MNGAARNAERLTRPHVEGHAIHGPRQHAVDAVDRLLVVIVAVGRSLEALRTRNHQLERRDAAVRLGAGDQEAHSERSDADRLVGRVDAKVHRL